MLSKYKGQVIDGAVLRYIAVVAMFTDHLAFCFESMMPHELYTAGRCIGRIAYPIFAYCLVAGYYHTRDIKRYAGRILAAALISEIPFNLMYSSAMLYPDAQNVMWTLLISLGMLWGCGQCRRVMLREKFAKPECKGKSSEEDTRTVKAEAKTEAAAQAKAPAKSQTQTQVKESMIWLALGMCQIAIVGLACLAASALRTDYGAEGVLIVAAFALMPRRLFDIPRGSYPRYLFYAFYPVHMLLIVLVRYAVLM